MGIYSRSQSAVLISLLVVLTIGHAQAATRKYVKMPSDSNVTGSAKPSSRTGDKIFVPGDGQTEFIPVGSAGGSRSLPVDPTYQYSAKGIARELGTKLKGGNLAGAAASIGLGYMLDQIGAFIEENQVRVPSMVPVRSGFYWLNNPNGDRIEHISATAACAALYPNKQTRLRQIGSDVDRFYCDALRESDNYWMDGGGVVRFGTACGEGTNYDPATGACMTQSGSRVATDADFDLMEAAAAAKDSEWLKQRLREHCEGSIAPQRCYDSLRESTSLSGPSTIDVPGTTSVTTGPAGTTTTTTNTKIDITYGDNYYDYSKTTTKVTTKPDGTTETSTETEAPGPVSEEKPSDEDVVFDNPDFPPVEPFYVQKYPDGLQGVWDNAKADFEDSEFISFLNSFVPQFSGSCPSWSMSFGISAWANYGTVSFMNLCHVFDFIKVIMLVTALFTARAITFGG